MDKMSGDQAEGYNRDLPIIQIDAEVEPRQALAHLHGLPQAYVVSTLYAVHHRGRGPGDQLVRLIDHLRYSGPQSGPWDDTTVERIAVDQTPQTRTEEEFMYVINLKGSLIYLSWMALGASTLPNDLKADFNPWGHEEFTNENYDEAIGRLGAWARENPDEANKSITDIELLEKPVTRVCERLQQLAAFYNTQQPLLAVYKVAFPEGYIQGKLSPMDELISLSEYATDMRRFSIIASLLELFGAEDKLDRFLIDMGVRQA